MGEVVAVLGVSHSTLYRRLRPGGDLASVVPAGEVS